jgi:hypothetical protein
LDYSTKIECISSKLEDVSGDRLGNETNKVYRVQATSMGVGINTVQLPGKMKCSTKDAQQEVE